MSRLVFILGLLLLTLPLGAEQPSRYLQLKERAERADAGNRGKLYAELARETIEEANREFTKGEVEKGQARVQEAVGDADKALEAARASNKKLKDIEITIRKAAKRLDDVRKTLAFEDRAPLDKAVRHLEEIRTQLLAQMFGQGKEKR